MGIKDINNKSCELLQERIQLEYFYWIFILTLKFSSAIFAINLKCLEKYLHIFRRCEIYSNHLYSPFLQLTLFLTALLLYIWLCLSLKEPLIYGLKHRVNYCNKDSIQLNMMYSWTWTCFLQFSLFPCWCWEITIFFFFLDVMVPTILYFSLDIVHNFIFLMWV